MDTGSAFKIALPASQTPAANAARSSGYRLRLHTTRYRHLPLMHTPLTYARHIISASENIFCDDA